MASRISQRVWGVRRYDVGMSSMVAMELRALANLSIAAFNPPRQRDHDALMAMYVACWADARGLLQVLRRVSVVRVLLELGACFMGDELF